jgi:hypothetical protein
MTTIIRAEAAHDFLALLPSLAGYSPERSLLAVAFRGNRTAGVIRHDLPRRARDRSAVASLLVAALCRMPGVDAVVAVAYTDDTFARRRGLPERALLQTVVARAEEAGFLVRDALCVAADGWGSLRDPATPVQGHPLALIETSSAASHPVCREARTGGVADLAVLPDAEPEVAEAVARTLAALVDDDGRAVGFDSRRSRPVERLLEALGPLVDPVEFVEVLLAEAPEHIDADRLAWLVHLAGRPAFRDAMMLQFAFGPVIGELALDDSIDANERAAASGVSIDELVARELAEGAPDGVDGFLSRLLLGQTTARPEPRRIERSIAVLRRAIAQAPPAYRPGSLCIAAWLAWSLGRGSAAAGFLDQALAIDGTHSMARLLCTFLGSGAIPEWAFSSTAVPATGADGGSDQVGRSRPSPGDQ